LIHGENLLSLQNNKKIYTPKTKLITNHNFYSNNKENSTLVIKNPESIDTKSMNEKYLPITTKGGKANVSFINMTQGGNFMPTKIINGEYKDFIDKKKILSNNEITRKLKDESLSPDLIKKHHHITISPPNNKMKGKEGDYYLKTETPNVSDSKTYASLFGKNAIEDIRKLKYADKIKNLNIITNKKKKDSNNNLTSNNHLKTSQINNTSNSNKNNNININDFACCTINNVELIQDKLRKYCISSNISLKEKSSGKIEICKEYTSILIEFTKVGLKGMNFMKMTHLSGNEQKSKDIIKNLIINIGL